MSEQSADDTTEQGAQQSQPNPVEDNAKADVLPQTGKPSQAEGDDVSVGSEDAASDL